MTWLARSLLVMILTSPIVANSLRPEWRFRVLVTENFEIIHREGQKALAQRYAIAAEQAHELLLPIFKEGPNKTYVVLQDDTDIANGLADFLPYPHIVVYPVLPTQNDSIDEFGDWPLEMMIHEYAHILNIYPAHGFYRPLKYLLGSVVRPNAVLPRWYLEGLAVNLESRLSKFGRLRSPDNGAALRALRLGDRLRVEDIASVNESQIKSYPYGARPYLFGGWWWEEAHRRGGESAIYGLNQTFSRRLPFLLNSPARKQIGSTPSELLDATFRARAALADHQISVIRSAGGAESKNAIGDIGDLITFAVSPSGLNLVYWLGIVDKGSFAILRARERPDQTYGEVKAQKLFRSVGTTRIAWLSDEEFVFDQIDARRPHVQFRDLYRYNLKTGRSERLTDGARAFDAAVSPDGRRLAFIQNEGGQTKLSLLDLSDKSIRPLVGGSLRVRLASPEFLDDHNVLFIVRAQTGQEKIHVHDLRTKRSKPWGPGLSNAQALRRTPAGWLVTDAGTGARNVYRIDGQSATPLTNTLTGIQLADYDPHTKELLLHELTHAGPRLKALALAPSRPPRIESPKLDPPTAAKIKSVKFKDETYWPISYLAPRYLIPMAYLVEDGFIVQGQTAAKDPIGRNSYSLMASFDTVTNKASYGGSFENRSLPAEMNFAYFKSVSYLGASGRLIEADNAKAALTGPLGSRFREWTMGGSWSDTAGARGTYRRIGPFASIEYSGLNSPYQDIFGWHADLTHQEFMEQTGYLGYGRTALHLTGVWNLGRHRLGLQSRAAVAPQLPFSAVIDLGDRNVGGNYLVSLTNSQFLLRGYPSGTFVGRKIVNANLEWALPAAELARGFYTFPVFLRELELAVFADTMAIDGGAYSPIARGYVRSGLGEFYSGTGAEFRLMTTMAYHVPVSMTLGLYYGFNEVYGGGFSPFVGFGLGSLSPISKKTP